jgi:hypothetical protein
MLSQLKNTEASKAGKVETEKHVHCIFCKIGSYPVFLISWV